MAFHAFFQSYKNEFSGYSWEKFRQDALSGLTVAAVALPLALAFGIASGATAAAGLMTSIIASVALGLLAGAPYQVSGPTAGLVGVLYMVAQRGGVQGIWLAGFLAGFLLLVMGLLKLGRLINYLPAPAITGFTSSVSLVLLIGQMDRFLGIETPGSDTYLGKLLGFFEGGFVVDWRAVAIGLMVIAIVVVWPKPWEKRFPASLAALVIATVFNILAGWPVDQVGAIPQTLLLPERLTVGMIFNADWPALIGPALSIAMLIAMESLLCGAVMSNLSGIPFRANQELIAHGVGNAALPFFGGIPAVATLIRSSVMLKSGGQTRVAGLVKGLGLLLTMLVFAPVMSRVPLAALAGVLLVTAWRMNKWGVIRAYFAHRYTPALLVYAATLAATIAYDLVVGLLAGVVVSILLFLWQSARMRVKLFGAEPFSAREEEGGEGLRVVRVSGRLFFGTASQLNGALGALDGARVVIAALGAVPLIDASGVDALREYALKLRARGGRLLLAEVNEAALRDMRRGGLLDTLGEEDVFESVAQARVESGRQVGRIA